MQNITKMYHIYTDCDELNIAHSDVCYKSNGWLSFTWTATITCHSGFSLTGSAKQTCKWKPFSWAWSSTTQQLECVPGNKMFMFR